MGFGFGELQVLLKIMSVILPMSSWNFLCVFFSNASILANILEAIRVMEKEKKRVTLAALVISDLPYILNKQESFDKNCSHGTQAL